MYQTMIAAFLVWFGPSLPAFGAEPAAKLTVEVRASKNVHYAAVSTVLSDIRKSVVSRPSVSLHIQDVEGISARIHASPEVAYHELAALLAALKKAGVNQVTLRVK